MLGDLHGFSIRVHEILYSYYFAPLVNKVGFYHLRSRDSAPLVEEPSRGIRGNYPFGDGWNNWYIFLKVQEPFWLSDILAPRGLSLRSLFSPGRIPSPYFLYCFFQGTSRGSRCQPFMTSTKKLKRGRGVLFNPSAEIG